MNPTYKHLRALLAILTDEGALDDLIFDALERNGTPVSRSRLQGWRVGSEHKNYRHMTLDEYNHVLEALIKHYGENPC